MSVVTPEEAAAWVQEHRSVREAEPGARESAVWLAQQGLLPQRRPEDEVPHPRPAVGLPSLTVTGQEILAEAPPVAAPADEWYERELGLRFALGELDGQRKQLLVRAYRADSDEAVEVAGLVEENEAESRRVHTELERVGLLRQAVAEEAEAEVVASVSAARSAGVMDARRLQCRREDAARLIDEAAVAYAMAVRVYTDVCHEQRQALMRAGWSDRQVGRADPFDFGVAASFVRALGDVGLSAGLFDRCVLTPPAHRRPLADVDARPVEPAENNKRSA